MGDLSILPLALRRRKVAAANSRPDVHHETKLIIAPGKQNGSSI
jgi:hypothetical protein